MPLKIELRPHESIIVGKALITNENTRARLYIDGDVPILREKFIMREIDANTPARRVYFLVQQLYLLGPSKQLNDMFIEYVRDIQKASPSLRPFINKVGEDVVVGNFYSAIRSASQLIEQENILFGEQLDQLKK